MPVTRVGHDRFNEYETNSGNGRPGEHEKWGWFVAPGIGELIPGDVASTNLTAANFASVSVIGSVMVVAEIFQIIHAFPALGLRGFLFWQGAGIVYADAGAIPIRIARSAASGAAGFTLEE